MIVERIWTGNSYRNFNYLIACAESGEALAIDPLDHRNCLATAKDPPAAHSAASRRARGPAGRSRASSRARRPCRGLRR